VLQETLHSKPLFFNAATLGNSNFVLMERWAHLHVFETEDGLSLDIDFSEYSFLVSEDDWEQSAEAEMERYLSIGEVFAKSQTIQYIYDLGDYWLHRITLAYWKEDAKNSPTSCILAVSAVRTEDGGSHDYFKMVDILRSSNRRNYEVYQLLMKSSVRSEMYLEQINKKMCKIK